MQTTIIINRSELYKKYKSEKPLEDKTVAKNNTLLGEFELLPCVKLLYKIYLDNINLDKIENNA